jgi:hypothetical protein
MTKFSKILKKNFLTINDIGMRMVANIGKYIVGKSMGFVDF